MTIVEAEGGNTVQSVGGEGCPAEVSVGELLYRDEDGLQG